MDLVWSTLSELGISNALLAGISSGRILTLGLISDHHYRPSTTDNHHVCAVVFTHSAASPSSYPDDTPEHIYAPNGSFRTSQSLQENINNDPLPVH
ncbi:hypothetical protein DSO57_1034590 [Entomophthora muscae]|uniref:Uncharacterized protein n=1 Tax=Entomophthora muscae TaxID=34485 RepID=A0ACC2U8T8_9FUNG|nr:hypothetical protein DSO57_1034590 [Entomophthora muscae]